MSNKPTLTPEMQQRRDAFRELLEMRHSCRAYLPDPVEPATLDSILNMAQRTASWCNTQPWEVLITRGPSTDKFRQALTEAMARPGDGESDFPFPLRYEGAYLQRRRESGFGLYNAVGIPRGDAAAAAKQSAENFRLFGAPHVAIVTTDQDLGVYGAIDCGAWVGNFMLAAAAHGVASIAQAALAQRPDFLRSYFNLPGSRRIVCGISFGYSDEAHAANRFRTSREPIANSVRIV